MIEPLDPIVICDLVDVLPRHPQRSYPLRDRTAIDRVVVHHSATPAHTTPASMARYHVRHHGWPGIGYHFVVAAGGECYRTNAIETHAYHAAGYNRRSVGVCFVGNFMEKAPPPAQLAAGARLAGWLLAQLTLAPDAVVGHGEVMATDCPGRQWMHGAHWKAALLQEIDAWLVTTT